MLTLQDLRPYQQRTVTQLYESDGLIAVLPMGGGKTISALTAASEMLDNGVICHAFVIAPKRVATLVWPTEIALWSHLEGLSWQLLNGNPEERLEGLARAEAGRVQLTIIGIDHVQWLVEHLKGRSDDSILFDALILDEISRFRNPKSKRAKALLSQVKRFHTIWGLTGTPRPKGAEDLFKPLAIVSRETLWGRSFYKWQKDRFYPTDFMGYNWAMKPDWIERTNAEAAGWMLTLDPADMPGLPEISTVIHTVELPEELRRDYRRMQRELFFDGARPVTAASAGVATGKLCQMVQGFIYHPDGRAETLHTVKREWIEDIVESMAGAPLIIVYEFIEDLAVLQDLFGQDLPYLGQGVSDSRADQIVREWNAGKLPLLAMHPASGGHGLNLQGGGSQMAWYGLTWSAELYEQTIKRIHRPGQSAPCFIHIALMTDTVDEMKRMRVIDRMSAQDAFTTYLKRI